ncbi:MAG: FGGY-family carbohydrate kinase, partial [Actinomycetota bacterium]
RPRPRAAAAVGLPVGAVVGPGTGDNMAAALGLGLRPGDVALSLGTSGTVYAVADRATADVSGHVAGFAGADGGFLPLVCTLNATKVTDTVAAWLGTDPPGLAELALAAPPGSGAEGPVLVPYFDGERTPNLPAATGLFAGLRTSTTRPELARAAHDGVLCGLLDGVDALRSVGVTVEGRLVLIGGGARSPAYRQRAADLHGRPVSVPDSDETVATGAAVQAAAVHQRSSTSDVADAWELGRGDTVEPAADDGGAVRAAYATTAAEVAAHHQRG